MLRPSNITNYACPSCDDILNIVSSEIVETIPGLIMLLYGNRFVSKIKIVGIVIYIGILTSLTLEVLDYFSIATCTTATTRNPTKN